MTRFKHDLILRIIKILDAVLVTIPFALCWYLYYAKHIASAGLRMHNTCCASAYQLLCKRTTAVVRPTELTSPGTYTIFSDNFICLFRQLLPYSAIVSYACVHLLKLFMCRKNLLGMSVFQSSRPIFYLVQPPHHS